MNACAAIEQAMISTLRQYTGLSTTPSAASGAGADPLSAVWIVGEQNETKDADFKERVKAARYFPQVRVTATPESVDENGWTWTQPMMIMIGTSASDDPHATTRAAIYEEVRNVVNTMYFQSLDPANRSRTDTTLAFFRDAFQINLAQGQVIHIGGMTLPSNAAPALMGEIQTIGIALDFHWYLDETTINAQ